MKKQRQVGRERKVGRREGKRKAYRAQASN